MENIKLVIIAKKLSKSIKSDKLYEIGRILQSNGGPYEQMVSVLPGKDFVKIVFLISEINKGETNFEGILWKMDNEGFVYAIGEVTDDQVTESCGSCGGSGQEDCRQCDGNGEENCSYCDGNGEDEEGETCDDCQGSGKIECEWCGGSGEETCDYCDGSGEEVKEDTYEISVDYYFSINDELKSELSTLDKLEELDSDKVEEFDLLVDKFKFSYKNDFIESSKNLDYNSYYFIGLDEDGEIYGKGKNPSSFLH